MTTRGPRPTSPAQLLVLAKQPVPGAVKTRLCPPCSPEQAATLAEAALADTLEAVSIVPAVRRLLVLDGSAGDVPCHVDVLPQRGLGLGERLANAFHDAGAPSLLIGMDTPQVAPRLLSVGLELLARPGVDAVLGPAFDGGYWAIGLRRADHRVFDGVPMSSPTTLGAQRQRLRQLGIRCVELPVLRDVDSIDDAWAVAATAPYSRFARTLRRLFPEADTVRSGDRAE
jgi:rSAM/selenodomain-associated transferase 1